MQMKQLLLNPEVRAVWGHPDDEALLSAYQKVWLRKDILRSYYESWYRHIDAALLPGSVVEIAAGTGNFKNWAGHRQILTTDILPGAEIAIVTDAHRLPFRRGSISNFVMIDALHHCAQPIQVFKCVAQCLKPGGRFVMLESFMSTWGNLVFKFFHHEPPDFSYNIDKPLERMPEIWRGNPAMSRLVFDHPDRLPLAIEKISYHKFLSYPLCGGFTYRSLLPAPILRAMHKIERTPLFANRTLGLRILAVMTKH